MFAHDAQGQTNQIIKVQTLKSQQFLFVTLHHQSSHALVFIFGCCHGTLCGVTLVFQQTDAPLHALGTLQVGRASTLFDQPQHIVAVQN